MRGPAGDVVLGVPNDMLSEEDSGEEGGGASSCPGAEHTDSSCK